MSEAGHILYFWIDLAGDVWHHFLPKYVFWWTLLVFATWLFYRGFSKEPYEEDIRRRHRSSHARKSANSEHSHKSG